MFMSQQKSTALDMAHTIEADLRSLSVAARRQYPMVKEAAERGIIRLRAQKAALHRRIRQNTTHKSQGNSSDDVDDESSSFRVGGDVLNPFVLACNHGNASIDLLSLSISAIQRLLNHDCVEREDFPNIMRVLRIQALSQQQEVLLKALQTLPLITAPKRFDVPEDVIKQLFSIAFDLFASEKPIIHHTASATLQQMVTLIFDRVEERILINLNSENSDRELTSVKEDDDRDRRIKVERAAALGRRATMAPAPVGLAGNCRHAYLLFQDFCLLAKADRPIWVKDGATISKTLALEVISTLLSANTKLFHSSNEFGELLKQHVCPLVIETLQDQVNNDNFPIYVRTLNISKSLIINHYNFLQIEIELLFTEILSLLSADEINVDLENANNISSEVNGRQRRGSSSSDIVLDEEISKSKPSSWRYALALEILVDINNNTNIMHYVYKHYDCIENVTNLYSLILDGLSFFITNSFDGVFAHLQKDSYLEDIDESPKISSKNRKVKRNISSNSNGVDNSSGRDEVNPYVWSCETLAQNLDIISSRKNNASPKRQLKMYNNNNNRGSNKKILNAMHDTKVPEISLAQLVWHAYECILSFVNGFNVDRETSTFTNINTPPRNVNNALNVMATPSASLSANKEGPDLINVAWCPLLTSLENMLKVCNDVHIIRSVLRAYQTFINACGIVKAKKPRDLYLHSLCSFGLPRLKSVGDVDSNASKMDDVRKRKVKSTRLITTPGVELSAKNVQTLEAVFNIGHCLGSILGSSWHILLETCEKLESILSSYNDDGTVKANMLLQQAQEEDLKKKLKRDRSDGSLDGNSDNMIGKDHVTILRFALDRLFESSIYLDEDGLKHMIQSLGVLAIESMSRVEFASPRESPLTIPNFNHSSGKKGENRGGYVSAAFSTISRIAGRSNSNNNSNNNNKKIVRNNDENDEAYGIFNKVPFAWKKLVTTTGINVGRLDIIWELVSGHLETMCANKNDMLRAYGMKSMEKLICEALAHVDKSNDNGNNNADDKEIGLDISNVEIDTSDTPLAMQVTLLESVEQCFSSGRKDVQENAMKTIYEIIQNCGHVLKDGWAVLLKLLSNVATEHPDLVSLGFKSVQLIADDFLGNLELNVEKYFIDNNNDDDDDDDDEEEQGDNKQEEEEEKKEKAGDIGSFLLCIKCLADYAMQLADVNISLTAIGTLWAVGDHARQQMNNDSKVANAIWIIVLKQLELLSLNDRAPVRNCALQTMFTTLVTHGEFFSMKTWGKCIAVDGIVFGVMDGIERKCTLGDNEEKNSNKKNDGEDDYMIVHHSRDTTAKQWNETRVIAMKELSRTIRSFFAKLNDMEFFGIMWAEILNIVRRGLLLVRDASNSADAEVQREVVIASIVFVSELMIIANNTLTLWNPTWMTLCEFGIKEDFKYDQEEELSRCIVRSLASLWQKTFEDDTTSTPLQTVAGQQAFLEYIFLILNNRVKVEGRYKHAKSPAEREYMEFIREILLPSAANDSNDKWLINFTFEQLLQLCNNANSNSIFVIDIIGIIVDMRGKVVDGDDKVLLTLLNIVKRAVDKDDEASLFKAATKSILEFVLPSVNDAKNNEKEDIWSTSWLTILNSMFYICLKSNTDIAGLFIERVVGYATCNVAPSSFTDQVVIKLKTAAKKNNESFHRETCIRHLFTLGIGENDSDMVIERCEELLEKYKNQQGNDSGENKIVTEADLVLSMESLLKVTKKLLEK